MKVSVRNATANQHARKLLKNPMPSLDAGGPEESPLPRDGVPVLVSSKAGTAMSRCFSQA